MKIGRSCRWVTRRNGAALSHNVSESRRLSSQRVGAFARATTATSVGILVFFVLFGCATGRGIPDGDLPQIVSAPAEGATISAEKTQIQIDIGAIDPAEVEHLRIDAYRGEEVAASYTVAVADIPFFDLPLRGLSDGESYSFRFTVVMRSGDEYRVRDDVMLSLAFGIDRPLLEKRTRNTFDPRPQFSWSEPSVAAPSLEINVDNGGSDPLYRATVPVDVRSHRPSTAIVTSEGILNGTDASWRARFVLANGVVGPWSESGLIVFTRDIDPIGATVGYGFEPTIVARPTVAWRTVPGSVEYRFEIEVSGERITRSTDTPSMALEPDTLIGLLNEAGRAVTTPFSWRVIAINELGIESAPSSWFQFVYNPLVPTMEQVFNAQNGDVIELVLGREGAPASGVATGGDETPQVAIRLPYEIEMARYEATADLAAAVFNRLIRDGRARVETRSGSTDDTAGADRLGTAVGVESGEAAADASAATDASARAGAGAIAATNAAGVVYASNDLPLVGLGELDFGRQFTLVLSSEGTIAPAPGYRSHPVVGVTWYGAVVLANELSLLAGFDEVYSILPNGEIVADIGKNGYRLPTEAEWAAAIAIPVDRGVGDDGEVRTVLREDRAIRQVELRGTNFDRSGDRWEDVTPPYTAAGGPTTPVGALGYATERGIADLLGNVWEWTGDWYDPQWYRRVLESAGDRASDAEVAPLEGAADSRGPDDPPLVESDSRAGESPTDSEDPASIGNPALGPAVAVPDVYGRALKVVRGGAWNTPRQEIRPTSRGTFPPDGTSHSIGIRLVRTLSQIPVQDARNN